MSARTVFDVPAIQARLLNHWFDSTDDERSDGAHWYPVTARQAISIDPSRDPDAVLGAMAVLSPRVTTAQNLKDLETILLADYVEEGDVAAFPANVEKAYMVLNGASIYDVTTFKAPKVRAFYRNLKGNTDAVTIDTWMRTVMLDIPYGERDNHPSLTPYQYGELARILHDTAHMIGVEPRTFQATVWIHARGKVN